MRKIVLQNAEILLEGETVQNGRIVLFLPGISGKVFSERFQPLVDAVCDAGLPIARCEMWQGESDVMANTFAYYHTVLREVVDALVAEGYSAVIAVGKSFGGGLLLSYHDARIEKKILWAPAIGITEVGGNFQDVQTRTLGEAGQLTDITLDAAYVAMDPAAIHIIHGTADTVIPFENSEAVVRAAQHGTLDAIEGADHSYKDPAHEAELLRLTKNYLSAT